MVTGFPAAVITFAPNFWSFGENRIQVAHAQDHVGRARIVKARVLGLALDVLVLDQLDADFRSRHLQRHVARLSAQGVAQFRDRRIRREGLVDSYFKPQSIAIKRQRFVEVLHDVRKIADAHDLA